MIRQAVLRLALRAADSRSPDFIIGEEDAPYLRRWWLIPRNKFFNVYLHHFMRSDDDRALHDHPWVNLSWLLSGSYVEWQFECRSDLSGDLPGQVRKLRTEGAMVARRPSTSHRVELLTRLGSPVPVWTIFITGPRVREWGFHCPRLGWRHWKVFVARGTGSGTGRSQIGRGCE